MSSNETKVAIVGLGGMGTLIASHVLDDGYALVGAVEVDDKVGKPISEFVEHPAIADGAVYGSIDDLIAAVGKPDVVVFAASIPPDEEAVFSGALLEKGINVLTLEPGIFEGLGEIAEQLDAAGKAGNATIIASGIQDTWWVHLPAVAAGCNSRITSVRFDDFADVSLFPPEAAEYEAGVGLEPEAWEEWREGQLSRPPVQGGPLLELARLIGFTPTGELTHEINRVTTDTALEWEMAGTTLQPGAIIGASFETASATEEGVDLSARLQFVLTAEGEINNVQTTIIEGASKIVIQLPQLDPWVAVPLGLVRRISDVVTAPSGLVRARELQPASYRMPVA